MEPLSKREYFAAMAKVPEAIIDSEMRMWQDDNGRLPYPESAEFYKMLKAVAYIESKYAMYKADALLITLNQ